MTSKALQIAQAIETVLTVPAMTAVPAASVYADPLDALEHETFPAVAVELGDEDEPIEVATGVLARSLEITITVLSNGSAPFVRADAPLVEAHSRIFADRTLGGLALDIAEGPTRRQREGMGEGVGSSAKTYRIQYRTTETSLES